MVLSCGIIHWRILQPANYRAHCNMRRWCIRRYILRSPYVPIFDYLQTKLWSRRRAPRCTLVIHDRYTRLLLHGNEETREGLRTEGTFNHGCLESSTPRFFRFFDVEFFNALSRSLSESLDFCTFRFYEIDFWRVNSLDL